ncbi:HMG-box, partial [Conidiobolus coronatus NRRL 28638]
KKILKLLKFERSFLLERLNYIRNPGEFNTEELISEGLPEPIIPDNKLPKRAEKDPNAPKRPSNAFLMFCQMERSNLKDYHPESSLSDLTKMLGMKWGSMTVEEKKKYYDMYENDKIRYKQEMSNYNPKNPPTSGVVASVINIQDPVVRAIPEEFSEDDDEEENIVASGHHHHSEHNDNHYQSGSGNNNGGGVEATYSDQEAFQEFSDD